MLGIFDVEYVLNFPVTRINEWYAYAALRDKYAKKSKDEDEKLNNAKNAARRGSF